MKVHPLQVCTKLRRLLCPRGCAASGCMTWCCFCGRYLFVVGPIHMAVQPGAWLECQGGLAGTESWLWWCGCAPVPNLRVGSPGMVMAVHLHSSVMFSFTRLPSSSQAGCSKQCLDGDSHRNICLSICRETLPRSGRAIAQLPPCPAAHQSWRWCNVFHMPHAGICPVWYPLM